MAAYIQMGHGSWNLIENPEIGDYAGVVLSPVNDGQGYVAERLSRLKRERRDQLDFILDPQLYNPVFDKGKLSEWDYFPDVFKTVTGTDKDAWTHMAASVAECASNLGLNSVCSPCPIPRIGSDDYYEFAVMTGDATAKRANELGIEAMLTVLVPLRDLAQQERAFQIASILTSTTCERIYLAFMADDGYAQRTPLMDSLAMPTAVHLVRLLAETLRVHVAFSGHDAIVWKYAGATDVSSGKFWNVRRFSPTRWFDEEKSVKTTVPYWNESPLLACLRDTDVLRLDREGWYDTRTFRNNPASARILGILRSQSGLPWTADSWIQYLRWLSNADRRCKSPDDAEALLERADSRWTVLDKKKILMLDRQTNGDHVRLWLNAVREGGAR